MNQIRGRLANNAARVSVHDCRQHCERKNPMPRSNNGTKTRTVRAELLAARQSL